MTTQSDSQPSRLPPLTEELAVHALPVVCDSCRAEGFAAGEGFTEIEDILDFKPVPRRTQVNNWTPEYQRAFIAALAITGSPSRAAAAIGRHARGVEKLLKARGSKEFGEAWEAALGIARDREMARLRVNMSNLEFHGVVTDEDEEPWAATTPARASTKPAPEPRWGSPEAIAEEDLARQEYEEAQERIRDRLLRARRHFLAMICGDAEARAAWEYLVGEVDWEKAEQMEPQDNEPFPVLMRKPDMLLTVEAGMLHDVVGAGRDVTGELADALAEYQERGDFDGPAMKKLGS